MPRFNQGDQVLVDGIPAIITAWPPDDEGVFGYDLILPEGAIRTTGTKYASNGDDKDGQVTRAAQVVLVKAGAETRASTAVLDGITTDDFPAAKPEDRVVAVATAHHPHQDQEDDYEDWIEYLKGAE
jgi:hypothetical protein